MNGLSFGRMPSVLFSLAALMVGAGDSARLVLANEPAKNTGREESWQVIHLGGQRVGYAYTLTDMIKRDGRDVVQTIAESNMQIKRFGQTLKVKQTIVTEETPDGDMLNFRMEMANPPATSTITVGTVKGTELQLTNTVNGKSSTTVQPWRDDLKSPLYQDRILRTNPLKAGETRKFDAFLPEFNKVATVSLTDEGPSETKLLDGKKQTLSKVKLTQTALPGFTMYGWLNEKGSALKLSTSMLGMLMETYEVPRAVALKEIAGEELDLAVGTLVKVKRNPNLASAKKATYRITTTGQKPSDSIPSEGTQSVTNEREHTADVVVTTEKIPRPATLEKVDQEFLKSTQYLQCDDERVKQHADKASGDATDPGEISVRMEKYVKKTVSNKNFSTAMASAAEVAKSLEGDCTEHAILLAAMLRSKGIPSRVVVGLVYVDNHSAFGGHMWTEAHLNGRWIPLDAAMGPACAAHIKMSVSSLSDEGPSPMSSFAPLMLVIGNMKVDVLAVE